jgi:hypothetical protein
MSWTTTFVCVKRCVSSSRRYLFNALAVRRYPASFVAVERGFSRQRWLSRTGPYNGRRVGMEASPHPETLVGADRRFLTTRESVDDIRSLYWGVEVRAFAVSESPPGSDGNRQTRRAPDRIL